MKRVRDLSPGDTFAYGVHPLVRLDGLDINGVVYRVTVLEGDYAGFVGLMYGATVVMSCEGRD